MFLQANKWYGLMRWAPAVLLMALIFNFSATPASALPSFGGLDFLVKKSGHFLEYAFLASAYWWGLDPSQSKSRLLPWLLAVLFAITDELHQSFVPTRNPWLVDVCIDSLGAWLGLFAAGWLFRQR